MQQNFVQTFSLILHSSKFTSNVTICYSRKFTDLQKLELYYKTFGNLNIKWKLKKFLNFSLKFEFFSKIIFFFYFYLRLLLSKFDFFSKFSKKFFLYNFFFLQNFQNLFPWVSLFFGKYEIIWNIWKIYEKFLNL